MGNGIYHHCESSFSIEGRWPNPQAYPFTEPLPIACRLTWLQAPVVFRFLKHGSARTSIIGMGLLLGADLSLNSLRMALAQTNVPKWYLGKWNQQLKPALEFLSHTHLYLNASLSRRAPFLPMAAEHLRCLERFVSWLSRFPKLGPSSAL